jgi:hypothetical protein
LLLFEADRKKDPDFVEEGGDAGNTLNGGKLIPV